MTNRLVLPRRKFLIGLGSLIAAPAIVRATSLMPIRRFSESIHYFVDWAAKGGGDGSWVRPFQTIKQATEIICCYDFMSAETVTIEIAEGVYNEDVLLGRPQV